MEGSEAGGICMKQTSDLIFVFSKKVKDVQVHHTQIKEARDVEKIKKVIGGLPQGREKKLEEIELRTNPKNWIQTLINEYPSTVEREKMENLINDFTDSMKTRMREEEKYAIGMLSKGELILCHSVFGEETITPEWEVIPRMLDPDNVMRYIWFKRENADSSLCVKYYERYATDSFVEWLGLSQRDALYHFGGKYRIYTEIGGVADIFELTEDQVEQWIKEHPEIKTSKIKLPSPIEVLNITQIRVGRKKYDNPKDFLQDFYAEKYNLSYYHERFKEIINSVEPYSYKFFDEKNRVIKVKGDSTTTVVEKRNPNFDILFSTKNIECRESYLDELFGKFTKDDETNIHHAGMRFSPAPLEIKSMKIWNEICLSELTKGVVDYCLRTNLQDTALRKLLDFTIFALMDMDNQTSHIHYFLESFGKKFLEDSVQADKITKLEDKVIEFKSREYFTGSDDEIVGKLTEDLKKKLNESPAKIYLIGIEDDGTIDFLPDSRLKSDRLENIKQKIKQNSQATDLYLLRVRCQENKNILILIGGRL